MYIFEFLLFDTDGMLLAIALTIHQLYMCSSIMVIFNHILNLLSTCMTVLLR